MTNVRSLTERNVTLDNFAFRIAALQMLCLPHLCSLAVSEREGSRKLPVQAGVQSGENHCFPGKGDDKYTNVQSRGVSSVLLWFSLIFLLFLMHRFRITYTTCRSSRRREQDSLQKRHKNDLRTTSLNRNCLVCRSRWQRGRTSMKP